MKISINNFKIIRGLERFDIKPETIISGKNSSGKSSFIQLLLLLKQTVDLNSPDQPLLIDGEHYSIRDYQDILFNKDLKNKLEVSLEFNKDEIAKIDHPDLMMYEHVQDYRVIINIKFDFKNEIFVSKFRIDLTNLNDFPDQFINIEYQSNNNYAIESNSLLWTNRESISKSNVIFSSFLPFYYEFYDGDEIEKRIIKMDWIKKLINSFFKKISYIGPIRDIPKDIYTISKTHKSVGVKGENVAQILEAYKDVQTTYCKIVNQKNGIVYNETTESLLNAVKYWMCEVFDIANDIIVKNIHDNYLIELVNKSGLSTSIKHVGFGIGYLLPIVVEGLRMPKFGTLIIEQPETHLHPKCQSLLYDFLYCMTLQNKNIIIETHSDHFITRMRRRIAEDKSNSMHENINLTFIEDHIFRTIELDNFGTLNYFPNDFIEQAGEELEAIIIAQMKKRSSNK